MENKKFEKAIDVLLHQQAQLSADMALVKEEAIKRLETLERISINLYNVSVEHGNSLVEQSKNVIQLTKDVSELREAQKETNDRLNAVIYMAEKYFSGENGKSKK